MPLAFTGFSAVANQTGTTYSNRNFVRPSPAPGRAPKNIYGKGRRTHEEGILADAQTADVYPGMLARLTSKGVVTTVAIDDSGYTTTVDTPAYIVGSTAELSTPEPGFFAELDWLPPTFVVEDDIEGMGVMDPYKGTNQRIQVETFRTGDEIFAAVKSPLNASTDLQIGTLLAADTDGTLVRAGVYTEDTISGTTVVTALPDKPMALLLQFVHKQRAGVNSGDEEIGLAKVRII